MESTDENTFTCPYCRRNPSHEWADTRKEEELLQRDYVGRDYEYTYYRDTKKVFRVKICDRCNKALKLRDKIFIFLIIPWMLFFLAGLVMIFANKIIGNEILDKISSISIVISFIFLAAVGLFWLYWKLFHRTRVHVKFDKAQKCNALSHLMPLDTL